MTFRDARDMVVEFAAKLPTFDHTNPLAGCSIDRIEWLPWAAEQGTPADAIDEADRYAGAQAGH